MLKRAAEHVILNMTNNFMVREISQPEEYSVWHNFQKLRYHGLITPIRDDAGNRIKGQWLITRNGWAFLRGEIKLPAYVMVRDNRVIDHSNDLVELRNVNAGVPEIQTKFEYFDSDGKPVGFRPKTPTKLEQVSLL
jgi:hypothetical protein